MDVLRSRIDAFSSLALQKSKGFRYVLAFILVVCALCLQSFFSGYLESTRFLFLYPVIFICAWLFGAGPTNLSIITVTLYVWYYVIPPKESFLITSAELIRLGIFAFSSFFVTWIINRSYQTAKQQLIGIKKAEERLRLATEFSHLGIWELDLASGEIIRNLNHDQAFGYQQLLPSWKIQDFEAQLHPDDRMWVMNSVKEAIERMEHFELEFRVVWPDKSVHWMTTVGHLEKDLKGKPKSIVGTNSDITEKKKAETSLHEALFYRDEFLSIASHELKTPLTSLKLQSQMFKRSVLKKDPEAYAAERVDRLVDQADRQVNRLVRLVDDMLDISRIRTGKLSINKELVNVSELVKEVIERARPQFAENNHILTQLLESTPVETMCDRLRIEQVMTNLLSNAYRYGQGKPVSVKVDSTGSKIIISVTDQGIGIAPENHEKVFNRFQRAVPASEISGLGLGLYIARQIMEAHGGTISVKSIINQGSTFQIELPLVIA